MPWTWSVRAGGSCWRGLKSFKPVGELVTDKIVINEIQLLGVLSAGWVSIDRALEILARRGEDLAPLCTHMFPLAEADAAVRTLGRETGDDAEAVHIGLDVAGSA